MTSSSPGGGVVQPTGRIIPTEPVPSTHREQPAAGLTILRVRSGDQRPRPGPAVPTPRGPGARRRQLVPFTRSHHHRCQQGRTIQHQTAHDFLVRQTPVSDSFIEMSHTTATRYTERRPPCVIPNQQQRPVNATGPKPVLPLAPCPTPRLNGRSAWPRSWPRNGHPTGSSTRVMPTTRESSPSARERRLDRWAPSLRASEPQSRSECSWRSNWMR